MRTETIEMVVTSSIVCGYAITQPFTLYVDMQSMMQDILLTENEMIHYGENSKIVRHLQQRLSKLGYYDDTIDGKYGLLTEHAVKGFQSSHDIEIAGNANKKTMETLILSEKQTQITEIEKLLRPISYGEMHHNVKKVQEILFYHGYYKGKIDGIYGPLTEDAVFQIKEEIIYLEENVSALSPPSQEEQEKGEIIQAEVLENTNSIIQYAKSFIGTPYVWGGVSPNGFDCSGFIQFVYAQDNKVIPRTVNEIWNFSSPIDHPSIGDLLFFETQQAGPSHLGIYLGNGDFIHAGSSRGVEISNYKENDYWNTRYIGAKRIDL